MYVHYIKIMFLCLVGTCLLHNIYTSQENEKVYKLQHHVTRDRCPSCVSLKQPVATVVASSDHVHLFFNVLIHIIIIVILIKSLCFIVALPLEQSSFCIFTTFMEFSKHIMPHYSFVMAQAANKHTDYLMVSDQRRPQQRSYRGFAGLFKRNTFLEVLMVFIQIFIKLCQKNPVQHEIVRIKNKKCSAIIIAKRKTRQILGY